MSTSQDPAIRLRPRDHALGETATLAGIWRRGWISANGSASSVLPLGHWLARVQAEFGPPADVVLAEREGQVLAFMCLLPERRYLAQLFVEPHLHSQGLGRLLLDDARLRMPEGWRLHVATDNLAAQRFYERYGLTRGSVDRHPASGRERVAYHWVP